MVAGASGPVGSLVGQLAQLAGARAVGIAGGAEKCAYVREVLGFDAVVDRRAGGLPQGLARACPDGIDVYFESVGEPCGRRCCRFSTATRACRSAGTSPFATAFHDRMGHAARHHDDDREAQPSRSRLHQHRVRGRSLCRLLAGSRCSRRIWHFGFAKNRRGPRSGADGVHRNAVRPKLRKAVGSCWVRLDVLSFGLAIRSIRRPSGPQVALLSGLRGALCKAHWSSMS